MDRAAERLKKIGPMPEKITAKMIRSKSPRFRQKLVSLYGTDAIQDRLGQEGPALAPKEVKPHRGYIPMDITPQQMKEILADVVTRKRYISKYGTELCLNRAAGVYPRNTL